MSIEAVTLKLLSFCVYCWNAWGIILKADNMTPSEVKILKNEAHKSRKWIHIMHKFKSIIFFLFIEVIIKKKNE